MQATDGNFYGTTSTYGRGGLGTIFRITPDGTLTTLYSFCTQADCADGGEPAARLIQATNGQLYGTTGSGGANGYGTVFEVTQNGSLTTLYSFCGQSSCPDGLQPSQLLQAGDGNFYGTARYGGGRSDNGTVFRVTPRGTLTTLHRFCTQTGCLDGAQPVGGLVQATDGNFYGTTEGGGATGVGTVFKITAEGILTTLHSFDCFDGCYPYAALVEGTDGNFYGTTYAVAAGSGTVFRLSVGLSPFISLVRDSGKVGSPIGVLGQGFTGTTDVSVNGTPASFTVVSDTYLTAKVPSGATTGFVTVTTPSGTLTSNKQLVVKP